MNFNVHKDFGTSLQGYLCPDNISAEPEVLVTVDSGQRYLIKCDQYIAGAHEQNLHETGIVGFILDGNKIPGLNPKSSIEICDPETGFIFYRRFDPQKHIRKRVLRVETQFVPHSELDNSFRDRFQFFAQGIERHGFETTRQMIEVVNQPSTYVSGRIFYKAFQAYIDANVEVSVITLQDPFYELAVRLMTLSFFKKKPFNFVSEREALTLKPAIDYFHALNLKDEAAIKKSLKMAPKEILRLLESPLTQQVTAKTPSDPVSFASISQAIDTLAHFTYVHSGRDHEAVPIHLQDLLGIPAEQIAYSPSIAGLDLLTNVLRQSEIAQLMLEKDLILHHFVEAAECTAQTR